MIKIIDFMIEELENEGCNNGNYPHYAVKFNDGTMYSGRTCRCGRGCSNTDQLPGLNQEFKSYADFISFIND